MARLRCAKVLRRHFRNLVRDYGICAGSGSGTTRLEWSAIRREDCVFVAGSVGLFECRAARCGGDTHDGAGREEYGGIPRPASGTPRRTTDGARTDGLSGDILPQVCLSARKITTNFQLVKVWRTFYKGDYETMNKTLLRLYITGRTSNSERAVANLRTHLRRGYAGRIRNGRHRRPGESTTG